MTIPVVVCSKESSLLATSVQGTEDGTDARPPSPKEMREVRFSSHPRAGGSNGSFTRECNSMCSIMFAVYSFRRSR